MRGVCAADLDFAVLPGGGPAVTHFVFAWQTSRSHRKLDPCPAHVFFCDCLTHLKTFQTRLLFAKKGAAKEAKVGW